MDNLLNKLNILNNLINDTKYNHSEIDYIIPLIKSYLKKIAIKNNPNLKILCHIGFQNEIIIHNDFLGNIEDTDNFWLLVIDKKVLYELNYDKFSYQLCKIINNSPVLSIIGFPKQKYIYIARSGLGAFRQYRDLCPRKLLPKSNPNNNILVNGEISLDNQNYGILDLINENNVLYELGVMKMLAIAEGRASFFPCFFKTWSWETASGQLICEEAGCSVMEIETNKPLTYNINKLENEYFIIKN